ncbi:hypothetical protein OAN95_00160 [Alphaproteobacteria bacterium]|nr:hypothetical protein [Alphaproteobacteria bacterium]
MVTKDADRAAIAKPGHWLIPVTAAITAIMIAFAFGVAGYWLEGVVAALGCRQSPKLPAGILIMGNGRTASSALPVAAT